MRVLAVVAHPDDESFWMGGALAQHVRAGDSVVVIALADGVSARYRTELHSSLTIPRREHFHLACTTLGVTASRIVHAFPDQQADTVPQLDINRIVETAVKQLTPDRIYTHDPCDLNLDHRRVAEAVLVASRGICEVWSCAPECEGRSLWPFVPNRRVQISDVLDIKRKACEAYVEERRDPPHPRAAALTSHVEEFICRS